MTAASPAASNCLFCRLVAGQVPARRLWEDDHHLAFVPLKQFQPGHTLLVPKRHAAYLFDMADDEYAGLWAVAKRLAPGLRAATGAARVGVLVEGFSVPHVHLHLVPVNGLADIDPARERALPGDEVARLAAAITAQWEAFR